MRITKDNKGQHKTVDIVYTTWYITSVAYTTIEREVKT